jgi:hypothetical protein
MWTAQAITHRFSRVPMLGPPLVGHPGHPTLSVVHSDGSKGRLLADDAQPVKQITHLDG